MNFTDGLEQYLDGIPSLNGRYESVLSRSIECERKLDGFIHGPPIEHKRIQWIIYTHLIINGYNAEVERKYNNGSLDVYAWGCSSSGLWLPEKGWGIEVSESPPHKGDMRSKAEHYASQVGKFSLAFLCNSKRRDSYLLSRVLGKVREAEHELQQYTDGCHIHSLLLIDKELSIPLIEMVI
ncbi:MAG: hypothetical protein HYW24_04205 [Candidatus Aenigmarchaeota archaeon]|nr:hypothetical protein [Candidatus Aenigmarchaeota archaeon]